MRSLIVLTTLLALAVPSLALVNMCPNGTLPSGDSTDTLTPGETYTATNCTFEGDFTVNARDIAESNDTTTVTIRNSVVNRLLQFRLVSNEGMPTTYGPMYITVENNVFTDDAAFASRGSLPHHSVLTFQNNQMSAIGEQYNFEDSRFIMMYLDFNLFSTNMTVNIVSNTLTANGVTNYCPIFVDRVYENYGNNTFNIVGNTITSDDGLVRSEEESGYLMNFDQIPLGDGSVLRVESNTLTITNSSGALSAIYMYDLYGEGLDSLVSIRNNEISISTQNPSQAAVFWLYYLSYVSLHIDNNVISTNGDRFIFSDEIYQLAHFSITGNTYDFTNTSAGITASPIYLRFYTFLANSSLVIASNTITAAVTTPSNTLFIDFGEYEAASNASIVHCGNVVPWANSSTPVEQLFSPYVAAQLVYDADACIVVTTTTTTTTAGTGTSAAVTTTTVAGDTQQPSSSALASAGYALLVCLVAAMAGLA